MKRTLMTTAGTLLLCGVLALGFWIDARRREDWDTLGISTWFAGQTIASDDLGNVNVSYDANNLADLNIVQGGPSIIFHAEPTPAIILQVPGDHNEPIELTYNEHTEFLTHIGSTLQYTGDPNHLAIATYQALRSVNQWTSWESPEIDHVKFNVKEKHND